MTHAPRVTIVTRTKNRPVLLRRALASVLGQTLRSWELLIVNDGGRPRAVNDLVRAVGAKARGRIRVIHNLQSLGMEAASNRALGEARGDYVVIHDDDDTWEPTFLEECVAHMDRADACVGGVVTHSAKVTERLDGNRVFFERSDPYTPGLACITLMAMGRTNMFPPIAFLYRRSALDVLKGYRADLPVLGDWEFNLRFLSEFEIEVVQKCLANYHIRPATQSGIYSNSVVGGLTVHQKYDTRLRNQLLRDDMKAGRAGLGFLVNFGRLLNDQTWELRRGQMLDSTFSELRANGVTRFAVYGAGAVGRRIAADARQVGFSVERIVDRNQELWDKQINGVRVTGVDQALEEGCHTFVVASLTYAKEIKAALTEAGKARGIEPRIFELAAAA
jgi:glycosyltransferase involved in cell wall biosynthesis